MFARVQAQSYTPPPVAVILNRHARGVTPAIVDRIARVMEREHLYVSSSLEQSRAIARTVVERGYPAVLLGGGDGTFVQCLTDLRTHARKTGVALPSLGVLRLGTGNALASALDAGKLDERGLLRDLRRAADVSHHRSLSLMEVDGRLTPFAGVGLDANVQSDFLAVTRALNRVGIGRRVSAGLRYGLAVALRSMPRYVFADLPRVTVINRGGPAWKVGAHGALIGGPTATGEVLFDGPCAIATGSSIPFFGLHMKMFPYAQQMPGRFQLRCSAIPTRAILPHLPAIWRGEFADDRVHDFLVEKVELRVDRPVPFQIGGDLQPEPRERVTLGIAKPIRVV